MHKQNSSTRRAGTYPPYSEDRQQEISNVDFLLLQKKGEEEEEDRDGERNGVSRENNTCPNGKGQKQ